MEYPTDPTDLFTWLRLQLTSPDNTNVVDISLQLLQTLLSIYSYRSKFHSFPEGLESILNILKGPQPSAQIQYQCIYCIWLLSFVPEIAADLGRQVQKRVFMFVTIFQ